MKPYRLLISAVLVLGCCPSLGAAHQSNAKVDAVLEGLTASQIAQNFAGAVTYRSYEGGVAIPGADGFCSTGKLWRVGHRNLRSQGTFEIQDGRLCTSIDDRRECRYVFKDVAGVVYLSNYANGDLGWPAQFAKDQHSAC